MLPVLSGVWGSKNFKGSLFQFIYGLKFLVLFLKVITIEEALNSRTGKIQSCWTITGKQILLDSVG